MTCPGDLVSLEDWHYAVEFGCGSDSWRLYGQVFGHPNQPDGRYIFTSTPTALDETQMLLTTASGRVYRLGACARNLQEQLQHIRDDITRGGTQRI